MPTVAGLVTALAIFLSAVNLVPSLNLPWLWQALAAAALCIANLIVWHRSNIPNLSVREAAKIVGTSALAIAGLAVLDTGLGFLFGQETIAKAFWGSGPVGGILDAFLFLAGLLVGVPTLVRSMCSKYASRAGA